MSEHDEQAAIFQWASLSMVTYPELAYLFAIPNGTYTTLSVGKKMKAEGVKKGVPDLSLPCPKGKYHGFYLELKHGKNQPSEEQKQWIDALCSLGYYAVVAWGWEEAIEQIKKYLDQ